MKKITKETQKDQAIAYLIKQADIATKRAIFKGGTYYEVDGMQLLRLRAAIDIAREFVQDEDALVEAYALRLEGMQS